ncbi:MAG: efflux RND transporter periplasmic adaptor subunit [Cryomorphaceae bacterium]
MQRILLDGCSSGNAGDSPSQNAESEPLEVTAIIAKGSTSDIVLNTTGDVIADEEVDLTSEVAGRITSIGFKEGSRVSKGALLVKLNDNDLQASLRKAKHEKDLIEDQVDRQRQLLEIKGVSQQEFDVVENSLLVKESEIALLQAQLDKTEIRAPFSGIIGLRYVSLGANITPSTLIASLQSLKPVKIDFSIPEEYAPEIKPGQKVSLQVVSAGEELEAEIYAIEPRIDMASRTLQIRAVYANDDRLLRPGAFANVKLRLSNSEEVIEIPANALLPALKGANVFVLKNGKVEEQSIGVGQRFENTVQVVRGISPGDTVLTSGMMKLKPGMKPDIKMVSFEVDENKKPKSVS